MIQSRSIRWWVPLFEEEFWKLLETQERGSDCTVSLSLKFASGITLVTQSSSSAPGSKQN